MEVKTRAGSGKLITMTTEEIKRDINDGVNDAAEKAHIQPLTSDEQEYLYEIVTAKTKIVATEPGKEVVLTRDGGVHKYTGVCRYAGVPLSVEQALWIGEKFMGFDTMELGIVDYNMKPCKAVAMDEAHHMENVQMSSIIPVLYGAQPNLGVYYQSMGGKWPSPMDLMAKMKVKEAKEVQEKAGEDLKKDMIYLARIMNEAGADGLNFDSTASAGDMEFYYVLKAIEQVTAETPLKIEIGMAGEMVQGLHSEITYEGKRIAGMWPKEQGQAAEKAGASIFGPAITTKIGKSFPWNIGRSVTYVKSVTDNLRIPVHPNLGMGVGGIPMTDTVPVDVVTRTAKAMVEIAEVDGI